jgi:succinate-acetate transporter protein
MTTSANQTIVKDITANPAPLGLMGFGTTTILLSLHNAGHVPLGAAILAMGIFFGGLAQLIAGLMEWKKGNTFGMTVFASFGFFWLIIVTVILAPTIGLTSAAETPQAMTWLFFIWGIFSAYMTVGTIGNNRVTQLSFISLTAVLFLLSGAEAFSSSELKILAGYLGILAGVSAIYSAMAIVLNEALGGAVVPTFPVSKDRKTSKPESGTPE